MENTKSGLIKFISSRARVLWIRQ